jgi:hypothetical protein
MTLLSKNVVSNAEEVTVDAPIYSAVSFASYTRQQTGENSWPIFRDFQKAHGFREYPRAVLPTV